MRACNDRRRRGRSPNDRAPEPCERARASGWGSVSAGGEQGAGAWRSPDSTRPRGSARDGASARATAIFRHRARLVSRAESLRTTTQARRLHNSPRVQHRELSARPSCRHPSAGRCALGISNRGSGRTRAVRRVRISGALPIVRSRRHGHRATVVLDRGRFRRCARSAHGSRDRRIHSSPLACTRSLGLSHRLLRAPGIPQSGIGQRTPSARTGVGQRARPRAPDHLAQRSRTVVLCPRRIRHNVGRPPATASRLRRTTRFRCLVSTNRRSSRAPNAG